MGAGGGYIFIVWVFLLGAAASVWSIDQPNQPFGRFIWASIPLILLAMVVVGARHSELAGTEWTPLEDLHWVKIYNDSTGANASVWIGLCAGLLGASSALIYTRYYKPTPRPATTTTVMVAPVQQPVLQPAMQPVMQLPRSVEPQTLPAVPKSELEQKLDEYDNLRAAGKITDDEHAALRQRALAKH